MKNIGVRSLIVGLCLMGLGSWSPSLKAQIADRVYKTDYHIDPEKARELSVELDNISFFKDNEYTGKFTKGYSLPGLWVQGKAVYYPLRNIKLEAGVHMLIYHGANKYPSMAYQDIAYWKGDQYQKGVHVLPYFRAQMALSDHVNIVLGNIYGASNHNLIEPLYNPELNLTCDPEAGLQLLYDSKAFDLDVWVNWQSFIFREDVHQEAFTVGISSRVKYNDPASRFHFYTPVQGLVQHRGGEIDTIFNLVALLSAVGERNPQMAWNVNMGALNNSLEVARQHHCALFTPSSIGAFGPSSPKDKTPQDTIMQPTTIYGICKVTGELLGNYYHHKYGVDTRSVRFPGIISSVTLPGGGTTDYAVEIYYEAIRSGKFTCPVPSDVYMDMIYMPDALRACVELMEADPAKLIHRNSFNLASMSFTPEIICAEIKKRLPAFTMDYNVDPVKKEIAESWPNSLDDTCAREEWGWRPEWDLSRMTDDMLAHIRAKLGAE